ncbi:MAG: DUF4956 domain-containing protein [Clostridia bacterium]|nr:DUF4956 domain-containing protein [Clostridia bacterium]
MLDSIFANRSLSIGNVLLVLGLAVALGLIASILYMRQNKNATRSFAYTLVILPLITSTVIMVVNGNLGAGIAVAGSFSLIRFRSAQGSGQEILAVFLSASLGLCLGAGYVGIACLLLLVYAVAMILLQVTHFGRGLDSQRELRITIPEALDYDGLFDDLLGEHFSSCELTGVRTIEMGTAYQLTYRVTPGNNQNDKAFLDAVRTRNGNLPVSLGRIPDARNEM